MTREDLRAVVARTTPQDLPALCGDLAAAHAEALARMLSAHVAVSEERGSDENLQIEEAARRLGVSKNYLYRHGNRLPFAVRIGRRLLFSAAGLEKWNRTRHRA